MTRGRLEAFSDAVVAILMTIMVLELRPPEGSEVSDLESLVPNLLVYLLSFLYLAIYWNNHHHLFHVVEHIDGAVLWANMGLLFFLSLVPFATAWVGEHPRDAGPMATYGMVLLGAALAFFVLTRTLLRLHEPTSRLAIALGRDWKGKLSAVATAAAIPLAYLSTWVSLAIYVGTALVWLVPDRRIARVV